MSLKLVYRDNWSQIPVSVLKFNGGEVQVTLEKPVARTYPSGGIEIFANLWSSDSIMELLMATDAIRRMHTNAVIHLTMPYFPYGRQDRVCAPGQALSARVMADIINAQNYASVEIWDAHSDVTVACLDRCIHVPASKFVSRFARGDMVFVAPDAGAKKKVEECARVVGATMIEAGKTRNVMTGEITGTIVHSDKHIGERDFLIIDDICDGGRTFLELAKLLRTLTAGKIKLYVTHGIFSKGTHIFDGLIDKIYVANPFPGTMEITRV